MVISEIKDTDLQTRLGHSEGPRTTGVLHVSEIYKRLMIRLQPKRFNTGTPMDMNRVEIGLLFENMLERALAEKFATVRPGELVSDEGVYMSPDGINPGLMAGEEYKSTYCSSRGGIFEEVIVNGELCHVIKDKFFHWTVQMLAYARWLEVRRFMLRVLFVCGDYSRPIAPAFHSYQFDFTDKEVHDNWEMLMTVAREEGLLLS